MIGGIAMSKMDDAGRIEGKMRRARVIELAKYAHKNEGTPETHAHHARRERSPLDKLHESGAIDAEQKGWAEEIAAVAEMIERDVTVRIGSYEPRIDHEHRGGVVLTLERITKVRRELAYGRWRTMLPMPKRLVLDMIVGEPIPFSMAARRYGIRHQRCKKILIAAIDRWPDCLDWAFKEKDERDLEVVHQRLS
jgi:hypothetical protein